MFKFTAGILAISSVLLAVPAPGYALEWSNITDERLLNADKDPNNWLIYGRTYNSNRFSPLNQINAKNVKKLSNSVQQIWRYNFGF